jgi:glycosyltransferase involved in cell wall biosynthesis
MLSCVFPNVVVTDAGPVQDYYLERFAQPSILIPYGAPSERVRSRAVLDQFGLEPAEYILYVSRLEPENNAHVVIKAFEQVKTDKKLVIVGDAPYSTDYIRDLKSTRDDRILFTGYVFGSGYREFLSHAYAYVQATEVGGTHPALVEAMGHGNCVLANDVPEHREVVEDTGLYFEAENPDTLVQLFRRILRDPDLVSDCQKHARQRVRENYSWEQVTDAYETLFRTLCRSGKKGRTQ